MGPVLWMSIEFVWSCAVKSKTNINKYPYFSLLQRTRRLFAAREDEFGRQASKDCRKCEHFYYSLCVSQDFCTRANLNYTIFHTIYCKLFKKAQNIEII